MLTPGMLNSNIRCIEINIEILAQRMSIALNSNIRCIEIKLRCAVAVSLEVLNSNIRCIEMAALKLVTDR